jgi:glutathione reductase (NADPH)
MSGFDVDLFVIGGGSGGVRAARIAAGHGAKVMVAEEYRLGGTCVIRGCVPKKLYVYASRFRDDFEDAAGYGWTLPEKPVFHWPTLVAAKEKEIARLSGLYRKTLEGAGVAIVETRATVTGPNSVKLASDGRTVTAKHILVAVGAAPSLEPAVEGIEHAISSNELFDLPEFPKRLLIVGGGYIAVEFASVFARLGANVTLVMRADNVLRGFDGDMRAGVRDALAHAGVDLRFGTLPTRLEKTGGGFRVALSKGEPLDVDQVVVATGRLPHTRGLGLDSAGVATDGAGAIKVDGYSRTSAPSIHAVGDVTNRLNLTPVAIREGHAFADTVFGGKDVRVDHSNVATAVFTTPELGTVGLTEEQARERHDIVDIYSAGFRPMKATLSGRAERTLMKIVVDGATDKVLGVHILGHEAGEMAQLLGVAVKMGATKADLDATMAVHPTAAEELVTMRTRSARHQK